MAKATKGLKPKTRVGKAMALIFPVKVRAILKREDAVRANDIESVHQMRVATKRLREAARLFRPAFGRRRMAGHIAHLQTLNTALGSVRELDVLGLHIKELGEREEGLGECLKPLIEATAQRRAQANAKLIPVLDGTLGLLEQDFAELLMERTKKRKPVWRMRFVDLGCQSVEKRVLRAFALEQAARDPKAVTEFHQMRIAIKKLKYAMELFMGVLGKRTKKAYKAVSALQELMGLVHDCDVLLEVLQDTRQDTLSAEVCGRAREIVLADRARLHTETVQLLDEMHAKDLCRKLLKAVGCVHADEPIPQVCPDPHATSPSDVPADDRPQPVEA